MTLESVSCGSIKALSGKGRIAYQGKLRVRCDLNGFGFPRFQLRATSIGHE